MTDQTPAFPPAPPPPVPAPAPQRAPSSGLALASLITGIAAVVMCGLGALAGPVAVILGIVAGTRTRYDAKAVWGIVLGAVGTVFSVIAIVAAFAVYADDREEARGWPDTGTTSEEVTEVPDVPEGEPLLTEAGVAASGYATAYEAWAATYDSAGVWDGLYEGDDIDSPCYSLGGEVWWVSSADATTCDGESELWWEDYSGTTEREIKLFGSGGVGAAIVIDAVPADLAADVFATQTLDGALEYVVGIMFPESGITDYTLSDAIVAGERAFAIEVNVDGLEDYRMYVLQSPRPYDEVGGVQFFTVRVYNEVGWVYTFDDAVARFEQTFTWK